MNPSFHRLPELFAQLGLPNDELGIARFLNIHARLAPHVKLADAPFWSPSQAALLREELLEDADWAEVVDQLDVALRKPN